jgi:hypothetical protein
LLLGALIALPASADAAVTVGPDVTTTPLAGTTGCTTAGNFDTYINSGPIGASPISGVVVRFRVRAGVAGANGLAPELRIVKKVGGATYTGAGSSPPSPFASGIATNAARLPISAGDFIGVDIACDAVPATRQATQNGTSAGAAGIGFSPKLVDGGAPDSPSLSLGVNGAFLLNADVEADADHDVFGDETQDRCPGVSGANAGCTAPTIKLEKSSKRSLTKLVVKVTSNEPGTAKLGGTVKVPGGKVSFRPRSLTLIANQTKRVKLKLKGRSLRRATQALADGHQLKARVIANGHSVVGDAADASIKIKLKG